MQDSKEVTGFNNYTKTDQLRKKNMKLKNKLEISKCFQISVFKNTNYPKKCKILPRKASNQQSIHSDIEFKQNNIQSSDFSIDKKLCKNCHKISLSDILMSNAGFNNNMLILNHNQTKHLSDFRKFWCKNPQDYFETFQKEKLSEILKTTKIEKKRQESVLALINQFLCTGKNNIETISEKKKKNEQISKNDKKSQKKSKTKKRSTMLTQTSNSKGSKNSLRIKEKIAISQNVINLKVDTNLKLASHRSKQSSKKKIDTHRYSPKVTQEVTYDKFLEIINNKSKYEDSVPEIPDQLKIGLESSELMKFRFVRSTKDNAPPDLKNMSVVNDSIDSTNLYKKMNINSNKRNNQSMDQKQSNTRKNKLAMKIHNIVHSKKTSRELMLEDKYNNISNIKQDNVDVRKFSKRFKYFFKLLVRKIIIGFLNIILEYLFKFLLEIFCLNDQKFDET